MPAQLSIGVEIRSELTSLGCQLIKRYSNVESLLKKGLLKNGDAKTCGLSTNPPFCYASTVYLNSFLFVDEVKMFVLSEMCLLPRGRIVYIDRSVLPKASAFLQK
ncbi:hypothetical protein PPTG_20021 [Phytophthora nicotianae INRA-310]|uniref:Uncharacterized protein n=2 Tax=Phytophthora nicotianae TaxID=4792 RepID=W2P9X7_PHYN3|nr:hypothetical protein PPTG_20021 [Phytophthora nicotianae INRA-310]ETM48728.1 hypothetical protein L914_06791 [Phytophthora nicotianae]ETM97827.1 hypothetical protein PPTG_20021 [Phytophthora nicotianae INRA-310]